jgi:hypothetical protein
LSKASQPKMDKCIFDGRVCGTVRQVVVHVDGGSPPAGEVMAMIRPPHQRLADCGQDVRVDGGPLGGPGFAWR